METNYSKAIKEYRNTDSYSKSAKAMMSKGMNQPYIDNILTGAFAEGWGDKPIYALTPSIQKENTF